MANSDAIRRIGAGALEQFLVEQLRRLVDRPELTKTGSPDTLRRRREVAKAERSARDPLADGNMDRQGEVRAVEDESVEFAVFAAGVDASR